MRVVLDITEMAKSLRVNEDHLLKFLELDQDSPVRLEQRVKEYIRWWWKGYVPIGAPSEQLLFYRYARKFVKRE